MRVCWCGEPLSHLSAACPKTPEQGDGRDERPLARCEVCDGRGWLTELPNGLKTACQACGGTGFDDPEVEEPMDYSPIGAEWRVRAEQAEAEAERLREALKALRYRAEQVGPGWPCTALARALERQIDAALGSTRPPLMPVPTPPLAPSSLPHVGPSGMRSTPEEEST